MLAKLKKGKKGDLPDTFWIEDLDTLRALADPTRLQIIELLVKPLSVKEIAEEMAVPRTRLYHHIKTLEQNGLIRVVGERKARALNERVFVAAAKEFRPGPGILEEATGDEMAEALLTTVLDTTRADFIRAVRSGVVRLDEIGEHQLLAVGRCLVRLPEAKAEKFAREVEDLVRRMNEEDTQADEDPVSAFAFVFYPTTRRTP
ncbi:MAG TPA: helix-turn-helix domain-containing protein [Acidimicrobiia bacterium]|nr:helix-turn-helix domain-containing protein [Acidimicrobiia bacterium]